MEGRNPVTAAQAKRIRDSAQIALEHALPRNVSYVVLIQAEGLNTVGSNLSKSDQLKLCNEACTQLQHDVFQGRL